MSSGSFGIIASGLAATFAAAFFVFGLDDLAAESLEDFGVAVPLTFGVFSLIVVFGFLTDSVRCGVWVDVSIKIK